MKGVDRGQYHVIDFEKGVLVASDFDRGAEGED